jgi:hypothetical protein
LKIEIMYVVPPQGTAYWATCWTPYPMMPAMPVMPVGPVGPVVPMVPVVPVVPVRVIEMPPVSPNSKDPKDPSESKEPRGYRIRLGKWEEVYDAVDGTKTWFNTATRATTAKDPFR